MIAQHYLRSPDFGRCAMCALKLACKNMMTDMRNKSHESARIILRDSTPLRLQRHFSKYTPLCKQYQKSNNHKYFNQRYERQQRNDRSQRHERRDMKDSTVSSLDLHEDGDNISKQIMKSRKVQNLIKDLRIPHDEVVNIMDELSHNLKYGSVDSEDGVDAARNYIHNRFQELDKKERAKRRAMTVKKFFPRARVDNLLTWSAKEQIRYLNRESPEIWSPESLASAFPCTVDQVKEVLKDKKIMYEASDVQNHDKMVRRTWEAIAAGESRKLEPETVKLLQDGTLSVVRYSEGNPALPSPPPNVPPTVPMPAVKSGVFSMIIQDHLKQPESGANLSADTSDEKKFISDKLSEEIVCSADSLRALSRAKLPSRSGVRLRREKLDASACVAYKSPPPEGGRGPASRVTFREFARRHSLPNGAEEDNEFATMKSPRDYVGSYHNDEYLADPAPITGKRNQSLRRESLFDRVRKDAKDLLSAKRSGEHPKDKVSPELDRRSSLKERSRTFRVPNFKFPVNSIS